MLSFGSGKNKLLFLGRCFSKEASLKKNNLEREAIKILHQQLKARKQDFMMTNDKYRVDVGFVVCRMPIFYQDPIEHLEMMKIRYDFAEKHNRHTILHKDIVARARQLRERGGPAEPDNSQVTHEGKNDKGELVTYSSNSKYFRNVDPNIKDNKSVQYCPTEPTYLIYKDLDGKWGFPSLQIRTYERLHEARDRIVGDISRTVKVQWRSSSPVVITAHSFPEEEIRNSRDPIGKKVFFFEGVHMQGLCECDPKWYQECLWAPKAKMNQYLDRETFQSFVHLLTHH